MSAQNASTKSRSNPKYYKYLKYGHENLEETWMMRLSFIENDELNKWAGQSTDR